MKPHELKRLHLIRQVLDQKMTQQQAAEVAGLSTRQIRRLTKRIQRQGDRGIIHRKRGQPSNRRIAAKIRKRALWLYAKHYPDFGPTLGSEKLDQCHQIVIHAETLRLWLRAAHIPYKQRKSRPHRQWRPRRSCFGEMVQLDGSHHDWLEGRGPELVLMGYIDDATNTVHAHFYNHEGTVPALDSFGRYIQRYGIPCSVYLDKHSTYRSAKTPTTEEQLEGLGQSQSQFQRAMSELGVAVIHAHSPAAKGRIERLFQTFQNRLVKEMRLKKIRNQDQANTFLETYLPQYNLRFGVVPAQTADLHRPPPASLDLKSVLSVKTQRRLNHDHTLAHGGKLYQIEDGVRAKTLTVEERLDGSIHLRHQSGSVRYREILHRPAKVQSVARSLPKRPYTPAADHPWRGSYKQSSRLQPKAALTQRLARGDLPPS